MPQTLFGDGARRLDYGQTYKARVVNRTDPLMEGRVGVFVPNLVTDPPADTSQPNPQVVPLNASQVFTNPTEHTLSGSVTTDVYIWARPAAFPVENGAGGSNSSGSYYVPKLGTMVELYFEGRDPNKPYWRQASPTVQGDVIAGKFIGQGTNLSNSGSNWTSASARPDLHVLVETDQGHIIYLDKNSNSNAFVIRWANGHAISITDADQSGIILETAGGARVRMDDKSNQVTVTSQTGKNRLVLDDASGKTMVTTTGGTVFTSDGDMDFSTSGAFKVSCETYSVEAQLSARVTAAGGAWNMDGANTMSPWYANDPHND